MERLKYHQEKFISDGCMDKNNNSENLLSRESSSEQGRGLNRRGFLKGAGGAVLGAAALSTGLGLFSSNSYAAERIGKKGNASLLKMARDVYPHDTLEDKYYQQVMKPLSDESSTDSLTLKLIEDGLNQLDKLSVDQYGMAYLAVKKESDRVVILKTLESTAFFQKVKGALMMGIYNNEELWPRFGYGGSAWEKGGYIYRGYNDIDWL